MTYDDYIARRFVCQECGKEPIQKRFHGEPICGSDRVKEDD